MDNDAIVNRWVRRGPEIRGGKSWLGSGNLTTDLTSLMSYRTTIARWVDDKFTDDSESDSVCVVDQANYSVTTCKHQNIVNRVVSRPDTVFINTDLHRQAKNLLDYGKYVTYGGFTAVARTVDIIDVATGNQYQKLITAVALSQYDGVPPIKIGLPWAGPIANLFALDALPKSFMELGAAVHDSLSEEFDPFIALSGGASIVARHILRVEVPNRLSTGRKKLKAKAGAEPVTKEVPGTGVSITGTHYCAEDNSWTGRVRITTVGSRPGSSTTEDIAPKGREAWYKYLVIKALLIR